MTQESPIVIEDREELIFILSEASSLEHMIMCEYLFAAFSLKRDVSEGVTAAQLEAMKRWERVVSEVAMQEMLHLSLVSNLLSAVGSIPFFNRPNFPAQSRYYPTGVQLALLPFGHDALQHFLYLERPEGMELEDAPEFMVPATPEPAIMLTDDDHLAPIPQDFATVGHLYRGIEQGLRHLVEKYGEKQVFIGPPRAQATQEQFGWPELVTVTDLASAIRAIETIVEQGEGARGDWQDAHYGKFLQVMQEYSAMKQQDPAFEPARPVVGAFVHPPLDASQAILITDPVTAGVAEVFNACYQTLLQILIRYFMHGSETEEESRLLSKTAVDAMFFTIKPLGELLTRLPVGPHLPGKTAGASFEIYRAGNILPHHRAAWIILHERLLELASYCTKFATEPAVAKTLSEVGANLRTLATGLEPYLNK